MREGTTLWAWWIAGSISITLAAAGWDMLTAAAKIPDLRPYLLTKPRVLFVLRYGEGKEEIGLFIPPEEGYVSGPSDFEIGLDGNVYIGDEQNGKVKKFTRSGRLLMMTQGHLDRIADMAVDSQGRIYVIHGARLDRITVFDTQGRVLQRAIKQIKSAMKGILDRWQNLVTVTCDVFGNLYWKCRDRRGKRVVVKLDKNWNYLGVIELGKDWNYFDDKGNIYSFQRLSMEPIEQRVYDTDGALVNRFPTNAFSRWSVTIHDAKGKLVKQLRLPNGPWTAVERLVPVRSGSLWVDGRGHFYLLATPPNIRHVAILPRFSEPWPCAILEYDENGRFVGLRAVIVGKPMFSPWVKVDWKGNVYWLDFKADHLEVMMAPVPKE
jgi:hypothetical protein